MIHLIPHLIDHAAENAPDSEAVRFLDEVLSYRQLAGRANALAHTLVEAGVGRRQPVGIYMDKSLSVPVAMYGIMKAGAAYVPLDPSAPPQRLAGVIADCGIRCLVSAGDKRRKLRALLETGAALDRVIGVEDGELPVSSIGWGQALAGRTDAPPARTIVESDLAYIIYTSGSTGQPKGIMHTHYSGLSFARWAVHEYGLSAADRLSNHAPLHFDLSIFDYFAGAMAGASTTIIPEEYTRLPASYSQLLADQRVSVLFTVPFALIQLLQRGALDERDLSSLRWAIFGGEPFPLPQLRALQRALPQVRFDNMYGPAETNGVTHYTVGQLGADQDSIPIGRLSANAEALVVDADDQPVADGEIGELLIRSPTMMQGYWQRPELNASAFYRRTVADCYEDVFYRSGDLVQRDADGLFSFIGRKDRQIKVRGYRVELDEIEAALCASDEVEEAAAVALPDGDASQRICALVTLVGVGDAAPTTLARAVRARLPWYAVPASIEIRDAFPRTTTGKIDRRSLRQQLMQRTTTT